MAKYLGYGICGPAFDASSSPGGGQPWDEVPNRGDEVPNRANVPKHSLSRPDGALNFCRSLHHISRCGVDSAG